MENFMLEALAEARKSLHEFNEVPVGCVFVLNDKIIARGHNLVNKTANPTRHAEFVCIDGTLNYCKMSQLKSEDVFKEVSVVVTVEPCIMCMSALYNLDVKAIIYGCQNDRFGGSTVVNVSDFVQTRTKVTSGLFEDEAMKLLKDFYQLENPAAPVSAKQKRKEKNVKSNE
jgi:tRNA-specific adenosine deaminase 2